MKPSEQDDPLGPDESPFLLHLQKRALGALLTALSLVGPLVAIGVFQREGLSPLAWVGIALSLAIWFATLLFRLDHVRLAAHVVIFSILIASVAGVVAHGTVRSVAVMVMLAGVVAAGSFLPRRTMIFSAVVSVLALAVLNWLEYNGLLRTPNLSVGWAVWITQSAVMVSVLVSVFHGRNRTREAFLDQERALDHAASVEAALRASEGRFMSLFHNNPVATLVQNGRTREVLNANEAFEHMFGYPARALTAERIAALWISPEAREHFRDTLRREGRVHGMRAQGRQADGHLIETLLYAEVIREGPQHLILTMVLDVSAEAASRQALKQSEERFSKAFQFSPIGMTITRLSDGRFMEVNPANERVLGYTQADFANRTSVETGVWVTEAERMDYIKTLQRDGRLLGYETRMRTKQGETVPVRVWSEIIEIDGEPCSLAFTMNVKEERQREATLMSVAEGMSGTTGEAFFQSLTEHLSRAIGADGVMVGEIQDVHRVRSISVRWLGQQYPAQTYPLNSTACGETLLHDNLFVCEHDVKQHFHLLPPFDGEDLQSFAGSALRDDDGTPIGLLIAVWHRPFALDRNMRALMTIFASRGGAELVRMRRDREIQKLRETLEQRVAERTAQLEYLNRELDTFAYTVSHDLKAPLRSIDGFSHLLREQLSGRLQDDDLELFDRVEGSVQRMNSLITDLLSLARVSQGDLQRQTTPLSELAEEVIKQERMRSPDRVVEVHIQPGLTADCDPRLARIVLENLIGNAWKYSRQQPDARIEFGQVEHPTGQSPAFFVRDNGAGFDMSRADRLFKPFTRLHTSKEFEGTGIGLATVRRILERHGGDIHADAHVGGGAVFEFSFGHSSGP